MQIIKEELLLKDIDILEKRIEDLTKKIARNGQDKESIEEKTVLDKVLIVTRD